MPKNTSEKISLGLAPMYGITDFPTRLWFYLISSCKEMTTPFLRVTETYPNKIPYSWAPEIFDKEIKKNLGFNTIPQLMASCPQRFIATYEMIKDYESRVEINCGCPSSKVVGHGAGSSLLKEVNIFKNFISTISKEIPDNLFCVKIRTGYANEEKFFDLVNSIKDLNLKKLTIHGRTKEQKYSSYSRWDLISEASNICPFPVIASGDIVDTLSHEQALKEMPKIKGMIIGRGALRKPWIFHELLKDEKINIDKEALFHSIICYALIFELFIRDINSINLLICKGFFKNPLLLDRYKWKQIKQNLEEALFITDKNQKDFFISRITLGRLKLLMGYLFQELLQGLDRIPVLRSKNYQEFSKELYKILINT